MRRALLVPLTSALVACGSSSGPRKLGPDELVTTLERAGLKVERGDSIAAMAQNSELSFWLIVDGHGLPTYRFESVEVAKDKAGQFEAGVAAGYWAFNCSAEDREVCAKIVAALPR